MKRRRLFKSHKSGLWWWEEFWGWRLASTPGRWGIQRLFCWAGARQLFQTGGMRRVKGSGSIRCELMRQEGGELCQECRCLCRTPFSRLARAGRLQGIKAAGAARWSLRRHSARPSHREKEAESERDQTQRACSETCPAETPRRPAASSPSSPAFPPDQASRSKPQTPRRFLQPGTSSLPACSPPWDPPPSPWRSASPSSAG